MKKVLKIILFIILFIVVITIAIIAYVKLTHEPNWYIEENAVQSKSHPFAGFWKNKGCNDNFGWAIGPAGKNLYYISFCGPGGCFAEGTYRPNTTIIDDEKYNVVDENTIDFLSSDGWSSHVRCPSRT